jgi:hypothetical protein
MGIVWKNYESSNFSIEPFTKLTTKLVVETMPSWLPNFIFLMIWKVKPDLVEPKI